MANPSNSSLLPEPDGHLDPSRLSSTSTIYGGLLSSYRLSNASAISDAEGPPIAEYGTTSARRHSSPIPFLDTAVRNLDGGPTSVGRAEDAGFGGLHRRSSSRVRTATEGATVPSSTSSASSTSLAAVASDHTGHHPQWGSQSPSEIPASPPRLAWMAPDDPVTPQRVPRFPTPDDRRSSTPSIRPLPREPDMPPLRSSTVSSTTSTSSIRPLPSPERSRNVATGVTRALPIVPSTTGSSAATLDTKTGVEHSTPPPRNQDYVDPFGGSSSPVPVGLSRIDSSWSFESDPEFRRRDSDDTFDYPITSRSPLQPTFSNTPPSGSKSKRAGRAYPQGTPESSPELAVGGSSGRTLGIPSVGVVRRKSLNAAVDVVRRIGVRVVNVAGAETQDILDTGDEPPKSPIGLSERKHPHSRIDDSESGFSVPTALAGATDSDDDDGAAKVETNALTGYTLGFLGPNNWLRKGCAGALRWRWTEPVILVMIVLSVVVLTIQSSPDVYSHPRPTKGYFHSWEDYTLFALYCCFTVEIVARIIVTGLVINPAETVETVFPASPGALSPVVSLTTHKDMNPFDTMRTKLSPAQPPAGASYPPVSLLQRTNSAGSFDKDTYTRNGSTTALVSERRAENEYTGTIPTKRSSLALKPTLASTPFVLSVRRQRTTYQQAFLRHSWNRLDAIAVIAFWITFALATFSIESQDNLYIFRALSVLRATRLLAITEGTTTILQSLKRAAPQLVQVAFFVVFAIALFSIVGIQSFKGSYRRTCVWVDPAGILDNVTFSSQHCGGYYDSTTNTSLSYLVNATGQHSLEGAKGFLCPSPSVCVETENPDNGVMSFDNIFAALLQVVIVASANTWTGIMYDMMDADFFVSCLFFIVCLIVLNYWLINMFVAVITNTFGSIIEETKHSAFASTTVNSTVTAMRDTMIGKGRAFNHSRNLVRKLYTATHLVWVAVVVVDIGFQASRTFDMTDKQLLFLDHAERNLTVAFAVEIVIRAFASLPDWRVMFTDSENAADLFLVVVTGIIQIPVIHKSPAYPWLTFFQIARFYRVILAIPRTKRLLVRVLGTFSGLVNMILFMIMMTFISALIGSQLIRGIPSPNTEVTPLNYFQIYNGFLVMYQMLSSENWTDPLSTVLTAERGVVQIVIAAIFLAGWMLFAYFILINMFIAVINENFSIAEEAKHKLQLEEFVRRAEPPVVKTSRLYTWLQALNPYKFVAPRRQSGSLEHLREYLSNEEERPAGGGGWRAPHVVARARRALGMDSVPDHIPLDDMSSTDAAHRLGHFQEQSNYIAQHPSYDRSLWIFPQTNFIRRFSQRLVDPPTGDGDRFGGQRAGATEKVLFKAIIFAAVIGSIAVAGVATPVYRRQYFLDHGVVRWTWFNLTEITLGFVFVLEFCIKIVADGFLYSPQAYLLSMWNGLDFAILIALLVNVLTALVNPGGVSRVTRALKALRALRLISLSPNIRQTFYDVLIVGASRIFDASILAILYIIPFAIWGQNVFGGLLYSCNDTSVTTKAECAGEFLSAAVSDWSFLTPRVWSNPYVWTFDSFRGAFLILFEIISLEGWISVLLSAMQITGRDMQPVTNASQFSGLFFVAFHLVGSTFILTLFVSVIIESFARRSGMSLLTTEQRQWIDLRKLITLQRPSKRPKVTPRSTFRRWCFDRAVQKHGWWSRAMTGVFTAHIIILMTQAWTNPNWVENVRNFVFLGITLIYFVDVLVRMVGLGWSYTRDYWNLFDIIVLIGTVATTVLVLDNTTNQTAIQLQKLFLVSIALKLVQKINSLNQLFKTATASLPAILNIFALWVVLFLVWAICYLEVFGLTRWGPSGTWNANYSTFWKTMILLELASTGEGWNSFMHDYTVEYPNCTSSTNHLMSDCGSAAWAFTLFISWNVLSMYLMSNLILGAVVENFSYVFQVYGKVKTIDREQMRSFKKTWSQIDRERTGFIKADDIPRFFARLTGVFEVRIYREKWSLPRLYALAIEGKRGDPHRKVDMEKLSLLLATIDPAEVRRKKRRYNHLYHEAMLEADNDARGISFTNMLLLLAHHCLISDVKALGLEEMLERREKTQDALVRVNADSVRGYLKRMVLAKQHNANVEARRRSAVGAPAIRFSTASTDGRRPSVESHE